MIAYKPYLLCPQSQRPLGVPLECPWVQQGCTEEEVPFLQADGWTVMEDAEYSTYVDSLYDVIVAYNTIKVQLGIEQVVSAAEQFGSDLMITFAAENVLLGITQDNMTGPVLDVLSGVMAALQAGSLYLAIARVKEISPLLYDAKYIKAARLLVFCNKIETYLGLPLSESL